MLQRKVATNVAGNAVGDFCKHCRAGGGDALRPHQKANNNARNKARNKATSFSEHPKNLKTEGLGLWRDSGIK